MAVIIIVIIILIIMIIMIMMVHPKSDYRNKLLLLHCWEVEGFWDSEGLCVFLVPRSKGWQQTVNPAGGATGLKRSDMGCFLIHPLLTCPLSIHTHHHSCM